MKKYVLGLLVIVLVGGLWQESFFLRAIRHIILLADKQTASVAANVTSPFLATFKVDGVLHEAGDIGDSSSPYFWLNSGGQFHLQQGIGKTVQGELAPLNKWRLAYFVANPEDTDDGYHPQNILRLLTRSTWQNVQQEVDFKVTRTNKSMSANRDASNGILLFNRYQNDNTFYYAGIRVDGTAVIKKKIDGAYYTLAQKPLYNIGVSYDRDTKPNLIPEQQWIGLKSEIKTNTDNTVMIKIFVDKDNTGNWVLAAEATDDGKSYGGDAIVNEGYAGIRTDFMDVEFDDYALVKF